MCTQPIHMTCFTHGGHDGFSFQNHGLQDGASPTSVSIEDMINSIEAIAF